MSNLRQNYCRKSPFKDELWTKVSSKCTEEHWFYAVNERRLFAVTVTIFVIAGGFLLFDLSIKRSETVSNVEVLDKVNAQKIDNLQKKVNLLVVSATPIVSQVSEE